MAICAVAILFDDIDAIVLLKEFDEMFRERHCAKPVVADGHVLFALQLIQRFDDRPVRRAKREDADICALGIIDFRLRHVLARRVVLLVQADPCCACSRPAARCNAAFSL